MSRTHHHCPKYPAKTRPQLGDRGLSIFRSTPTEVLSTTTEAFKQATQDIMSRRVRGEVIEQGAALNQLSINEVKRNKPYIGHVAVGTEIDDIYDNVASLRKPLKLHVDRVGLVGLPRSPMLSMAILFTKEDTERLQVERQQILDVLQSYTGITPGDTIPEEGQELKWYYRALPHVSIGQVPHHTPQPKIICIRRAMEAVTPDDISVTRATLHDPNSHINQYVKES